MTCSGIFVQLTRKGKITPFSQVVVRDAVRVRGPAALAPAAARALRLLAGLGEPDGAGLGRGQLVLPRRLQRDDPALLAQKWRTGRDDGRYPVF